MPDDQPTPQETAALLRRAAAALEAASDATEYLDDATTAAIEKTEGPTWGEWTRYSRISPSGLRKLAKLFETPPEPEVPQADDFYTSAPIDYDGFGTRTIAIAGTDAHNGNPVRLVRIKPEHREWQIARYASGCHRFATQAPVRDCFVFHGDWALNPAVAAPW